MIDMKRFFNKTLKKENDCMNDYGLKFSEEEVDDFVVIDINKSSQVNDNDKPPGYEALETSGHSSLQNQSKPGCSRTLNSKRKQSPGISTVCPLKFFSDRKKQSKPVINKNVDS